MSARRYSKRVVITALLLTGAWYVLSGRFDLLHFGSGVVVAVAVALNMPGWDDTARFRPLRFFLFIPWLAVQVIKSNLRVARAVLSPKLSIHPTFISHLPEIHGDRGLTLLGASITLTPGTLTVDIGEHDMFVHALDVHSAADIDAGVMAAQVERVFQDPAA
jgi:multicomponent Na+:H+ antiporter subunit E